MAGWPGEPRMDYDVLMAEGPASDSAGAPITDVMFDFGNVLVRWDPAAVLVSRYSEDTARRFLDDSVSGFYAANDLMDAGASIRDGVEFVARGHGAGSYTHLRAHATVLELVCRLLLEKKNSLLSMEPWDF